MMRVASFGSAIDRDGPVGFRFDGTAYGGLRGDTLASALLANGVRIVGRSFKFHRPRGVFTCGVEEPSALVQIDSGARAVPSTRATRVAIHEGMEAFSCSGWPSRNFDIGRALDFVAPLWAAGFYNRTFKWPSWHMYEWAIRRMAGFGTAPTGPDPDRYDTRNLHCDLLVIGGGESGLRAAEAAIAERQRVVLVEQGPRLGGHSAWEEVAAAQWAKSIAESLARAADTRVMCNTMAVGQYERDLVTLLEAVPHEEIARGAPRERYWVVRAKRIVLATGAIEQPLVFANNDRPGVMLAGAAREYLRRYAVAVGRRVLIATNNDSAYPLARDLAQAGVEVLAIADTRAAVPGAVADEMKGRSIPILPGSIPVDTRGFGALSSVTVGKLSGDGRRIESMQDFRCDALAVSGGWSPALHLYSQAGGKLVYDEATRTLAPATRHPVVTLVGSAAGEKPGTDPGRTPVSVDLGIRVCPVGDTFRQWVDLRHDVTVSDLELAIRENYASIEHVKRFTTVGMSVDQGKTSNVPTLEIVARLRGMKPSELGHTTMRPPYAPLTLGAVAGRAIGDRFAPARLLPMHDWHVANGALMEDYGEWKRPAAYPRAAESRHEAILREARNVRGAAGLFDGSSLGKIEVHGPDALDFLDRFYINNLKTLKPGRARYGFMLRESGILFDDGTVVMLAPDRFLLTTTTGNAGRVAAWLEEWHQCEWPHLRVVCVPVTDQWATISLAGPRARDILSSVGCDIDLSPQALPALGVREGRVSGVAARVYRVSFSGELSYEINVPARSGTRVWEALLAAGKPHGLQPFGVESLLLMRLEKGFLHLGTDTDGTTVPDDVGWGKVASGKAADFVGKRSLHLPENVRPDRLQLVGLTSDKDIVVGSHLRLAGSSEATDGWVTSAGRSVLDGRPIAMAMLRGGRGRLGADLRVHDMYDVTAAKVVELPFYDPAGERMNG